MRLGFECKCRVIWVCKVVNESEYERSVMFYVQWLCVGSFRSGRDPSNHDGAQTHNLQPPGAMGTSGSCLLLFLAFTSVCMYAGEYTR